MKSRERGHPLTLKSGQPVTLEGVRIENTQSCEWTGQWWLPQSQDRYYGTLRYAPEKGLALELIDGAFSPAFEHEHNIKSRFDPKARVTATKIADDDPDTIWGISGATKVTLFYSTNIHKSMHGPSSEDKIHSSLYKSSYAVIGTHISSSEDPVVASSTASIDYLAGVLEQPALLKVTAEGYRVGDSYDWTRTRATTELDFAQNTQPVVGVQVDDIGAISLLRSWKGPSLVTVPSGLMSNSVENTQFKVHFAEPTSLSTAISHLEKLTLLVSLVSAGRRDLTSAEIELIELPKESIAILLPRRVPTTRVNANSNFEPFFSLSNADFIKIMPQAIKFIDNHYRLMNLAVELWDDPPGFIETEILLSSILLEAFHKDVYGGENSALVGEARQLLEEYFDDDVSNQGLYFKQMVVNCYSRVPCSGREKLVPDLRQWANILRDTRNNLAHKALLAEEQTETARAAGRVTLAITTVLIFISIGIPDAKIDRMVDHHEKFHRIKKDSWRYFINEPDVN